MKCVECEQEMKDNSYWYYGLGDWDMDYPASHHEEHYCKNCNIKYENGEWIFPKNVELPTEKQKRTILFINNHCNLDLKALTKKQCIRYINKYFEEAKEIANRPCYDDYMPDYYEEYF